MNLYNVAIDNKKTLTNLEIINSVLIRKESSTFNSETINYLFFNIERPNNKGEIIEEEFKVKMLNYKEEELKELVSKYKYKNFDLQSLNLQFTPYQDQNKNIKVSIKATK